MNPLSYLFLRLGVVQKSAGMIYKALVIWFTQALKLHVKLSTGTCALSIVFPWMFQMCQLICEQPLPKTSFHPYNRPESESRQKCVECL